MPEPSVPTGSARQALFDELSAVFKRCGEQAAALDGDRQRALSEIAEVRPLLARREAAVRDARARADAAEDKADRALADTVQAADREYFDAAQAADGKREQTAADADNVRNATISAARERFEETIRAIHHAIAGLQAIADAEKRARDERDKALRDAEQDFLDAIRKADSDRDAALDDVLSRQIAARAAAADARSRAARDTQFALNESVRSADRTLEDSLMALPAARQIVQDATARRVVLDRACSEQKRAIEARLRGEV